MAQPNLEITVSSFTTHANYAAGDTINPALYGTPERNWVDAEINSIKFWHQTQINNDDILAIGSIWIEELRAENRISPRTAVRGLQLAMSLKSMDTGKNSHLLMLPARGPTIIDNVPAAVALPDTNTFDDTPFPITARQIIQGPNVPLLPNAVLVLEQPDIDPNVLVGEDSDRVKIWSYTFLAAYLMKLMIKSPDNVVRGLDNMKARYLSFYGPSRIVSQFSISIPKAFAYKDALLNQTNIQSTYTMALAHTQSTQAGDMDVKESGLLSYLGYIPFSYTGLHAYTLIIELKNLSNVPLGKMLTMLKADITTPALNTIHWIATNLERTSLHPNRATYFRYCAMWGAHYFASLRSSKCPHLLYTVACAWKILAAGTGNSDPENIIATTRLSEAMKVTLKRAGELLGDALKRNMLGGADTSTIYTNALNMPILNPAVNVVAEEEDPWAQYV